MNQTPQENILTFPTKKQTPANQQKFISILQKRFEKSMQTQLSYLSPQEVLPDVLERLRPKNFLVNGTDYYMGVFSGSQIEGVLVFTPQSFEAHENIDKCKVIISDIALPYFDHVVRARKINEEQRQIDQSIQRENILPLFKHEGRIQPDKSFVSVDQEMHTVICGKDTEACFRKALDLHHEAKKSFFLCFADLAQKDRESSQSLNEMGSTSIYISDFTQISKIEKTALIELCEKETDILILTAIRDENLSMGLTSHERSCLMQRMVFA